MKHALYDYGIEYVNEIKIHVLSFISFLELQNNQMLFLRQNMILSISPESDTKISILYNQYHWQKSNTEAGKRYI